MAAGYFLLLAQKKVTKENGTLGSAPLAQRAVRCGRTGSADRPSMACSRIGAIPRAARALRGFSVRPSPLLRGDPRARARWIAAFAGMTGLGARRLYSASSINGVAICGDTSHRFCGRDCRALPCPDPSRPRRAGAGNCPKGRAQDARAFDESTGTCSRRTPEPARAVCRAGMPGKPRTRGCLSLGYFSLDKQREVTGGHGWPTIHTRT